MAYFGCSRVCAATAIGAVMLWGTACARDNPDYDAADETSAGTTSGNADAASADASASSAGSADGDGTSTSSTSSNVDTTGSPTTTVADTGATSEGETGISGTCGDGVKDLGEECDDGNQKPDDGCFDCLMIPCGNGQLDQDEACDATVNAMVACNALEPNAPDGSAVCVSCEWDTSGCHVCGNGFLEGAEECEPDTFAEFPCSDDPNFEGEGAVFCNDVCQIVGENCCVPSGTACQLDKPQLCCSGLCGQGVCE